LVELLEDVSLDRWCTLRVGGPARYFVAARTESELLEAARWADAQRVPLRVLGGGSNVVISDHGFDGLVIRVELRGVDSAVHGDEVRVTAAAGEPWDDLVRRAVENEWAGIECLSGIPGMVGATPIQNVGAYGQEVAETIREVRVFDRATNEVRTLDREACAFAYRDSSFKTAEPERYIALSVTYVLERGGAPTLRYPELRRALELASADAPTLARTRETVLSIRRSKSMVIEASDENARSCGSFFVNPVIAADDVDEVMRRVGRADMPRWPQPGARVKLSAAWLIEQSGLHRNHREGPVGLSSRHTLAIVCHDGARSADVIAFARRVRARVWERSGVRLVPEPVFWGFASLDDGLPDDRVA
jgi:UDP-N-acetylmuramate dehydrogenase